MEKYPKLKKKEECAYPEREICNWDDAPGSTRCPYMKYDNTKSIFDSARWKCIFDKKKVSKSEHNQSSSTNEKQ